MGIYSILCDAVQVKRRNLTLHLLAKEMECLTLLCYVRRKQGPSPSQMISLESLFPSLVLLLSSSALGFKSLSMFALKALLSALLLSQSAFALTQSLLFQIPGKDLKKVQKSSADVLKCVQ